MNKYHKDKFYLNIFINDDMGTWVAIRYDNKRDNDYMRDEYPHEYTVNGNAAIYVARINYRVNRHDLITMLARYHRGQWSKVDLSE